MVLANPVDACKPIESPPQVPNRNSTKWFALISRYPCSFQTKVRFKRPFNTIIFHDLPPTSVFISITILFTNVLLILNQYSLPSSNDKVINAKNAGFDAAIIYNVDSASIRKYGNLLLFSSHGKAYNPLSPTHLLIIIAGLKFSLLF